jgi:uncharacterized protein YlbG (UPF0298 family)
MYEEKIKGEITLKELFEFFFKKGVYAIYISTTLKITNCSDKNELMSMCKSKKISNIKKLVCYKNIMNMIFKYIDFPKLKYLCVGYINLKFLPPTLINLECLRCSSNKIKEIPSTYTKLKFLNCENNKIREIPPTLTNLKVIYCGSNPIENLPNTLINLKYVSINDNKEINFIFDNYKNKFQRIYANASSAITANARSEILTSSMSIYTLEILDLPNLREIPNITTLTELNIKHPGPLKIHNTMTNLKKLNLDVAEIHIPDNVKQNINKLLLHQNLDVCLFINLKSLTIFQINNFILPETLINLEYLDCNFSDYVKIPDTYTKLKTLIIYNTLANEIPDTLINLEEIFLSSTVKKLPHTLTKLKKLDMMNSGNRLKEIPSTMTELIYLNCQMSQVQYLPDTLINCEVLCINSTNIREIPETYTKLKHINCRRSGVSKIPEKIKYLNYLSCSTIENFYAVVPNIRKANFNRIKNLFISKKLIDNAEELHFSKVKNIYELLGKAQKNEEELGCVLGKAQTNTANKICDSQTNTANKICDSQTDTSNKICGSRKYGFRNALYVDIEEIYSRKKHKLKNVLYLKTLNVQFNKNLNKNLYILTKYIDKQFINLTELCLSNTNVFNDRDRLGNPNLFTFDAPNLMILSINNTKIRNINQIVKNYNNLDTLNCFKCSIEELPSPELVPKLRVLDCSNTRISHIPQYLELTKLDCQSSKVISISYLPNLKELNCQRTRLRQLPYLPNLTILDIFDTLINYFIGKKRIKTIYINENKKFIISPDIFSDEVYNKNYKIICNMQLKFKNNLIKKKIKSSIFICAYDPKYIIGHNIKMQIKKIFHRTI